MKRKIIAIFIAIIIIATLAGCRNPKDEVDLTSSDIPSTSTITPSESKETSAFENSTHTENSNQTVSNNTTSKSTTQSNKQPINDPTSPNSKPNTNSNQTSNNSSTTNNQSSTSVQTTISSTTHTHSYGGWTTIKAATCASTGVQERFCSCGHKETKSIQKIGHTYNNRGVCNKCNTQHTDATIVIKFNDIVLKQDVAEQLGLNSNENITKYDMTKLTYLSIARNVYDIEPLKYASNLSKVFILSEKCNNLSVLCELKKLKTVQIGYQNSIDVTFMKNMPQVEEVYYNGAKITNGSIEDLLVSPNLRKVYFQRYNGSLTIFNNHPTIQELSLTYCVKENTDISPFLTMPKLKKLEIWSPYENISDEQRRIYSELSAKGVSIDLE